MYQVKFFDSTVFTGGDPDKSMWDMLPNKPIKSILYWVNDSSKFEFTDFEEYCHCVERVQGVNAGFEAIKKVIIMGRVNKRVYQVIFDLTHGIVHQTCVPYGQEYGSRLMFPEDKLPTWDAPRPLTGWLQGLLTEPGAYPGPKLRKIEEIDAGEKNAI